MHNSDHFSTRREKRDFSETFKRQTKTDYMLNWIKILRWLFKNAKITITVNITFQILVSCLCTHHRKMHVRNRFCTLQKKSCNSRTSSAIVNYTNFHVLMEYKFEYKPETLIRIRLQKRSVKYSYLLDQVIRCIISMSSSIPLSSSSSSFIGVLQYAPHTIELVPSIQMSQLNIS